MTFFHEQYKNQIKNLADQMRSESMPPLTEELFALFESTGNRLKYEEVYFARRKFLAVFGIATYIFGRQEDVKKLEEVLEEICAEECWALPAHVNRGENPEWQKTIDLFAAETAQALAEIVALVGKETSAAIFGLSKEVCGRARLEIERRVLVPFENARQGWECSDHNWNAVCCGSIGSVAMYLLAGKEEKRLEALLQRICHSLTFYLRGFREDGACMEGIGYFTYGMTYFVGFAEQLLQHSKGKVNLLEDEKVQKIAEFQQKMYFSGGQTISFSDGEKQAKFRMGLTSFLAKQYKTVRLPKPEFACDFETDPCYRFMGLLRDYLWTMENAAEEEWDKKTANGFERHDILPHAQWSICESRNGVGFAIKGGNNGEPHNHNDIGSFLYMAGGEQLICDLGAGEYTAEYFGKGRYNILCNSSEGHSVPVLNGEFQKDGEQYKASYFYADGEGTTRLEFAGAYQGGGAESIMREVVFSLEDGVLAITDEFALPESTETVSEQLVTQSRVIVQEREEKGPRVIISGTHVCCMLQLPENTKNLRVLEKNHSNHQGEPEVVRLIRWDVPMQDKATTLEKKGITHHGISKYTIWVDES